MQRLAMDLRMLSRELSLYLEHQVRVGFFGSGVGLSLILGFSVAYACYYLSSIAKKPQLVTGGESFSRFLQDHCPVVTETYYPTVWCWESRGQTLLRPSSLPSPWCSTGMNLLKLQMEDRFHWTGLIMIAVSVIWMLAPDLLSYCCPASLEQARNHISFI